jgi:methionyl aminopeptidase
MGMIKSASDLRALRQASHIAGSVCDQLVQWLVPGMETLAVEQEANRLLGLHRSSAPFKMVDGFGHAICISINEEVVNGPPSRNRRLQQGDVVSIALGSQHRGLHGKCARTVYLGEALPESIQRLLEGTAAVFKAVAERRQEDSPGRVKTLNDLLKLVPETARKFDLVVIDETGGCGIGKKLHEEPTTPNQPEKLEKTILLIPGMAFTLMPMLALGTDPTWTLHEDGWTWKTNSGKPACHIAETCLVTEQGIEFLTQMISSPV